ncbi:cobalamin synthase domain protein [Acinetobacter baumannii CI86]|nr:hypothetical protein ACINNAV18_2042 [Acinetobacter baumannii Naval-18]ETR86163.1 cobalamin synthase domain protein [Acinetobacter baumannii CI86]ETR88064.1 cobalamin synthase domain protein [Acinetobacter baumannii CI79]
MLLGGHFYIAANSITGDTVGAAIEIGETVLMFTFVVSYFYLV